jgi:hypothetical protein
MVDLARQRPLRSRWRSRGGARWPIAGGNNEGFLGFDSSLLPPARAPKQPDGCAPSSCNRAEPEAAAARLVTPPARRAVRPGGRVRLIVGGIQMTAAHCAQRAYAVQARNRVRLAIGWDECVTVAGLNGSSKLRVQSSRLNSRIGALDRCRQSALNFEL